MVEVCGLQIRQPAGKALARISSGILDGLVASKSETGMRPGLWLLKETITETKSEQVPKHITLLKHAPSKRACFPGLRLQSQQASCLLRR